MIRVLVASVDALAAAGLRSLLSAPDLDIVGQAHGPAQTIALARSVQPDVLVYDAGAAPADVVDIAARLRRADHRPALVALGAPSAGASVARALRAGVRAFIGREATGEELAAAVRAAADGLVVLHPAVAAALLGPATVGNDDDTAAGVEESLTAREHEVLQLLAYGLANKQIARRLAISEHTVKFHVGELMAKLGAASRTEAVTRAARRGLLVL